MQKKKPTKYTAVHRTKRTANKHFNPLVQSLKFLPAVLFFVAAVGLRHSPTANRPNRAKSSVLSYSTSISVSDLLAQTNSQRSGNGEATLDLNSLLTNAAQTKANDMVARDYWSHTTPTGQEPWVFITNAGYDYQTAGENLAYGFDTSAQTVTGWMNSPPHRQNLLNSAFSEVGFGFANSANYVSDGQQTVVVAMYAAPSTPKTAAAPPTPSSRTPNVQGASSTSTNYPTPPAPRAPVSVPAPETSTQPSTVATPKNSTKASVAQNTSTIPRSTAVTSTVRKIQLLTGGRARWSGTLLVASMCGVGVFWALERKRQLKHYALVGEHFILRHLHIDLAVAGFITLGLALLQTSGLVR